MGNVNSCGFLGGLCGGLWGSQRNSTSIVVEERAPTESRRCRSTKLVLQTVIGDGEHIICDDEGRPTMKIPARTPDAINRMLCDLDGEELWSVIKRPEGTYELYSKISEGPPVVVEISGTTQKPKPRVCISSVHPRGPKLFLKFKGNIMSHDYHILSKDSRDLSRGWVRVASSKPMEGQKEHILSIAAGISVSLIPALCIVLSEMKVFLSPDLNGMKFNPPVAIFDHRQISEKKTVLTPIVMQNSITVIDRDANTIVSREACDEGKGLFCNTAGDIAFNFEQRGKFLCIPLREPDGEHNQGFIVFSTSKACRGAKDILVSRVQSLAAMDRKDARKENCFLVIRVTRGANEPIVCKNEGRPNKCLTGQPIGHLLTINRSPDEYCQALGECKEKVDPKTQLGINHFGVSGVFAAGVDLILASAIIMATVKFFPQLGKAHHTVPMDITSDQVCCQTVLNLDEFD